MLIVNVLLFVANSTRAFAPCTSLMIPINPLLVPLTTTTNVLTSRFLFTLAMGGGIKLAPPYGNWAFKVGFIFERSFAAVFGVTN